MGVCLLVFLFAVTVWYLTVQPLASGQDAVSTVKEDTKSLYTAGYLLQLGSELKSPLLRLLGLTLCNVHTWSVWGEWSACSAKMSRTFGLRNRTRIPGIQDKRCHLKETSSLETDTSLCEGVCVSGFNITKHGYCVKYIAEKVHYDVAEKRCAEDGAHVININSDKKLQDLKEMYVQLSYYIYVDGRRTNVESPWVFSHGEEPGKYTWDLNEPSNLTPDLCMAFYHVNWRRHDSYCNQTLTILCEMRD